jgi:hypothetical protein
MSAPDFAAEARRLVSKWVAEYGMAWRHASLFMTTERDVADALQAAYDASRRDAVQHARKCCWSAASIAGLHSREAYDAIHAWLKKDEESNG